MRNSAGNGRFYLFGSVGIVWFAVLADAAPRPRPRSIRASARTELDHIRAHSAPAGEPGTAPPIAAFLKHPAVWAIIVAHFCNNWSLYVLLTWLPTFVNKGLGVNFASVGVFTMFPHIAYFVFLNVAGNVADRLIRGGMEVGRVRKLMQTIGFGGVAIALLIVGHVHSAPMAIAIMTLGNGIFAFTAGGFFVNHMDIAPRSAGTLMGITNTAATIPGIIGVYVSGLILDATGSWAIVFDVAAGVALFGLVFYLIFASGKRVFRLTRTTPHALDKCGGVIEHPDRGNRDVGIHRATRIPAARRHQRAARAEDGRRRVRHGEGALRVEGGDQPGRRCRSTPAHTREPEDAPGTLRAKRAHLNDVENIPVFMVLALLFTLTGCSATAGWAYFGVYFVARTLHTIFYLGALQPWRTVVFAIGQLTQLGIMVQLLMQVF